MEIAGMIRAATRWPTLGPQGVYGRRDYFNRVSVHTGCPDGWFLYFAFLRVSWQHGI